MTREHVFAQWLVREVHGARLVASGVPVAAPVRISRVVAPVCSVCNAGWMSGLEVAFRRIVFARPRVGPVPASDRVAMSRWFTKTALLLADVHELSLAGATRARIVDGMPEAIEVFFARRRRPPQPIDYAIAKSDAAAVVSVQVGDVVGHVGPLGVLAGRHGTQLWPLRSHTLRWETLPVITPLLVAPPSVRHLRR